MSCVVGGPRPSSCAAENPGWQDDWAYGCRDWGAADCFQALSWGYTQAQFETHLDERRKFARQREAYMGMVTILDEAIGTMMSTVESSNALRTGTLVVLTSDHGDMMGAHGLLGKVLMYDEGCACPS